MRGGGVQPPLPPTCPGPPWLEISSLARFRNLRTLAPLGDRQAALIQDYAEKFVSVTDEYATAMLKEFIDIREQAL